MRRNKLIFGIVFVAIATVTLIVFEYSKYNDETTEDVEVSGDIINTEDNSKRDEDFPGDFPDNDVDIEFVDVTSNSSPNDASELKTDPSAVKVTVYSRHHGAWKQDHELCRVLPKMHMKEKHSPIGPLQLYFMNDAVGMEEMEFDGRILFDQIWDDVSEALFKVLAPNREIALLDIGIGMGGYISIATKMSHHVIAVDPNKDRIMEVCKTSHVANLDGYVTILHHSISNTNTTKEDDQNFDLDGDIICDNEPSIFWLNSIIEFQDFIRYTKIVLRLDTLTEGVDRLLLCANDFFLHYEIEAVLLPWPSVSYKSKMRDFLGKHHLLPFTADGHKTSLQSRDFNYWPMHVMWQKTEE